LGCEAVQLQDMYRCFRGTCCILLQNKKLLDQTVQHPIFCIGAVVTQHIKSAVLVQLVTFGYMFRPLPGHHQANKE